MYISINKTMYLTKNKIINKSVNLKLNYKINHYFLFLNIYNKLNNQLFYFKISKNYFKLLTNKNNNKSYFFFFFKNFSLLKTIFNIFLNKSKELLKGFFIELEIKGLGYFVFLNKNCLIFDLNYSHFIGLNIPNNFIIKKFKNRLVLFSFTREELVNFSKLILQLKKIDIYKGKGIFLKGQKLKLKEIKKK